jgi:hypothetical protein
LGRVYYDRMKASCWLGIAFLLSPVVSAADPPFDFVAPPFLASPTLARSATGNTYLFRGTPEFPEVELRLTMVKIPPELEQDDATPCVEAFIAELRKESPNLFTAHSPQQLQVGSLAMENMRWTSSNQTKLQTGIIACGIHQGHYVAVVFRDRVPQAPRTFPAIRTALARMTFK